MAQIENGLRPKNRTKCQTVPGESAKPIYPENTGFEFSEQCLEFSGGRSRTRTYDPLIKSQLLYQLSYAPGPWNRWGIRKDQGRANQRGRGGI
jgi:hypothetical protein